MTALVALGGTEEGGAGAGFAGGATGATGAVEAAGAIGDDPTGAVGAAGAIAVLVETVAVGATEPDGASGATAAAPAMTLAIKLKLTRQHANMMKTFIFTPSKLMAEYLAVMNYHCPLAECCWDWAGYCSRPGVYCSPLAEDY